MSRSSSEPLKINPNDPLRDLFEACKCGDATKVRSMVDSANVNARDTAGRRSTPLHFAAGKFGSHFSYLSDFSFHFASRDLYLRLYAFDFGNLLLGCPV